MEPQPASETIVQPEKEKSTTERIDAFFDKAEKVVTNNMQKVTRGAAVIGILAAIPISHGGEYAVGALALAGVAVGVGIMGEIQHRLLQMIQEDYDMHRQAQIENSRKFDEESRAEDARFKKYMEDYIERLRNDPNRTNN